MSSTANIGASIQKPVTTSQFSVTTRRVPMQYQMQFYVDYGVSEYGPWGRVCLNDMELSVGWFPPVEPHRPSRSNKVHELRPEQEST